jgi:hypothetical protein
MNLLFKLTKSFKNILCPGTTPLRTRSCPRELWAAERVWVRNGGHMPPLYNGPYTVLQRSLRHFRLQMGNREDNISTSRLKPSTSGSSILMAAPPQRDRHRQDPQAM